MKTRRTITALVLLVVVSGIAGACAGSDGDIAGGDGDTGGGDQVARELEAPYAEEAFDAGAGGGMTTGGAVVDTGFSSAAELPAIGPSVIKTATVRIEVERDGLDQGTRDAIAIAERYGGYVSNTALRDSKDGTGSLEIRVPATRFAETLAAIREIGKVRSESVAGQDVGQEFVDLQARLRNFEAQETVLLRLMDRSVSVADTLRVQNQLQQVQLEIERLRGRIRYLEDLTQMSTIHLDLNEEGATTSSANAIVRAWRQAREVAVSVVAAVIVGAGFVLPIAVLLVLGFVVYRLRPRASAT